MYRFENEAPKFLPGQESAELRAELSVFFAQLDALFEDKLILWEQWPHDRLDHLAVRLCTALGYTRGAAFLTAYGYSVQTDGELIPARPAAPLAASDGESPLSPSDPAAEALPVPALRGGDGFVTGSVIRILPYHNSGFVRQDGGKDYYFNIRDFTHHVTLAEGLRVRFKLTERLDHKYGRLRLNAVELSALDE